MRDEVWKHNKMLSLLQAILIPEDHLCFKIVTYLIWLLFRLLFHSYDTPCHIIILTLLTLLLPFIIIFKKKNHFLEGNSATVLKTINGGATWTSVASDLIAVVTTSSSFVFHAISALSPTGTYYHTGMIWYDMMKFDSVTHCSMLYCRCI